MVALVVHRVADVFRANLSVETLEVRQAALAGVWTHRLLNHLTPVVGQITDVVRTCVLCWIGQVDWTLVVTSVQVCIRELIRQQIAIQVNPCGAVVRNLDIGANP